MPSEVDILKTKAANKKGAGSEEVETVWPKPEFVCHASLLPSRTDRSFSPSVFFFFLVVCVRGGWPPARGSDQVAVHIDLEKWARVRGGGVMKG